MRCTECRVEADDKARGWQAHRADLDDEEPELAIYCSDCAAREFAEGEAEEQFG